MAKDDGNEPTCPIVVLVNGFTASAAEMPCRVSACVPPSNGVVIAKREVAPSSAFVSAAAIWAGEPSSAGCSAAPSLPWIRSVPPGKRKALPVETTRHAFAYVFSGGGKFCNASGPLAVPTEGVGWADTAPPYSAEKLPQKSLSVTW